MSPPKEKPKQHYLIFVRKKGVRSIREQILSVTHTNDLMPFCDHVFGSGDHCHEHCPRWCELPSYHSTTDHMLASSLRAPPVNHDNDGLPTPYMCALASLASVKSLHWSFSCHLETLSRAIKKIISCLLVSMQKILLNKYLNWFLKIQTI